VRRSLYAYVADAGTDVGRDDAAAALHISRELCAFHLDKLVNAGLLEASYRRTSIRRGPGGGRPSKFYRRARQTFSVSLPPRRYDLASRVLIDALRRTRGRTPEETVRESARGIGAELAIECHVKGKPEPTGSWQRAWMALESCGLEPRASESGEIVMRNCPFDSLVREDQGIACGMNLGLVEGVLDGFQVKGFCAALNPQPGRCCVTLQPNEGDFRSDTDQKLVRNSSSERKDHHHV
jgi:predicted ArsR family transcriptional regulator